MEQKYKALGWHTEFVDLGAKVGKALLATNKPGAERFDVLLVGHLDTVFADGTAAERPFRIEGNMAYGPGVTDMKAGVLSMFYALAGLAPEHKKRLSIAVALNPDEEVGSGSSSAWLIGLAKKSRHAMILEPSRGEGGNMVKARKGMARYTFTFAGVASHAGNAPEAGRSAIHEMAHWILALLNLADKAKGTTMNIGLVSGGEAANIVADKATCVLDVRYWDNADYDRLTMAMKTMLATPFTPDITVTMERTAYLPAMYPTPQSGAFMKLVERCGDEVGVKVLWTEAGGGSDGNHIAPTGTPVLDGFGPTGGSMHSPKEFLELDSIGPRTKLVRRVLESL
jgi:glutamate carboxypeptidase